MVGLHATADAAGQPWPDYSVSDRIFPILLRSVLYIARTELFIIISIFLLFLALEKRPRTYKRVIAEQSRRLLVPYAFWTVFFVAFTLIKAYNFGYLEAEYERLSSATKWAKIILLGESKYHMHFIPTLFGVVLAYPLYRIAMQFPAIGLCVLAFLLVKSHLDAFIYSEFWGTEYLGFLVRLIKILTYTGYGIVAASAFGYYQNLAPQTLIRWVPIITFFGGLLFLLKLIASYKVITTGAYPYDYLPGYWADFLMPIALFSVCLCLSSVKWSELFSKYAKYSFGIYLCHPVFLDVSEVLISQSTWTPSQVIIAKIVVTIPSTIVFVHMLETSKSFGWTIGLGRQKTKSLSEGITK